MKETRKGKISGSQITVAAGIVFLLSVCDCVNVNAAAGEPGAVENIQAVLTEQSDSLPNQMEPAAFAQEMEREMDFDVNQFILPEEAKVLVVVEGTKGAECNVYAYERADNIWFRRVETYGYLGRNGMSNHRTEGDKTTPIGVFQMNTPFGQKEPLEGFPIHYLQVTEDHVWLADGNKMVNDAHARGKGEAVGTAAYAGYYDYAIDAGYNSNGIPHMGSALFLHCIGHNRKDTSGCVAIPTEQMVAVMRLYGIYGDGACYIAQAPKGMFPLIYNTYGMNNGLSPEGDFGL